MFDQAGLELTLLDESFQGARLSTALDDISKLRDQREAELAKVPEEVRETVAERVALYVKEVAAAPRRSAAEEKDFLIRYSVDFWRVIARKKGR
jgi:hypothetical protein